MKPSKKNIFLLKIVGLFSVVRGYNILVLLIAQYLSVVFILAPEESVRSVFFDFNLFLLIMSTSLVVASGYIINSFYDTKKDMINRPIKTSIDRLVSQKSRLYCYFALNGIACCFAFYVSWKAMLFFAVYIFSLWVYSHKLKRYLFIGNLSAAMLAITPFFVLFLYYKNLYEIIFFHALFLFILIYIKELIKDLENLKGDFANGYQTIPIVYSEVFSKKVITACVLLTTIPLFFLVEIYEVGYMYLYFVSAYVSLLILSFVLFRASTDKHYLIIYNIVKLIIILGVFSVILIEPHVILNSRVLVMFY